MLRYKYMKYNSIIKGGINKPCIVFIKKYMKNFNLDENITLDKFISYYQKNKPYYFFNNNELILKTNNNELNLNNEFNLKNKIIISNNVNDPIKYINIENSNNEFIFDDIICIYKDEHTFYYENLYEYESDESSLYKK